MKSGYFHAIAISAVVVGIGAAASAQEEISLEQAQKLQATVYDVKQQVDSIIDQARARGIITDNENDLLAVPPLLQASSSLTTAGTRADQLVIILSAPFPNFQLATYRFTQCCTATGLARSQVARARLGASAFPPGFIGTFDAQFADIINELTLLRSPFPTGVGCP